MIKKYFFRPSVKTLAVTSIMIALEVVLHRFVGIQTPILQLNFGFLPIAAIAMLYGPVYSGFAWAVADILGMLIFPSGGGWYFGFTVSAFIMGIIYGVFIFGVHKAPRRTRIIRISAAVLTIVVFITFALDMFWLHLYWGNAFSVLIIPRLIKCAVMLPLQIAVILGLAELISKLEKNLKL